jgi:hypothetical protein
VLSAAADAGAAGDVVQARGETTLVKHVGGSAQHPLAVGGGVAAQRSDLHVSGCR